VTSSEWIPGPANTWNEFNHRDHIAGRKEGVNIKEIKEMIQLMNENGLSEIELEKDGLKIKLKKNIAGFIEQSIIAHDPRPMHAAPAREAATRETTKPAASAKNVIKSPMVGTFYAAPTPDAPPFVGVGSEVQVGQVVCIIEAMKLMNEIKSEVKGKIVEISVNNGDPVEFGQVVFVVE
jgi:acetyl-CoA carboxylase biotin carboxyl carrier protein